MYGLEFLHDKLLRWCPSMHARRRAALATVVEGALAGAPLTVTSLGRAIAPDHRHKHQVKRVDRLLSNEHLAEEAVEIYRRMTAELCADLPYIPVAIDWSDGPGQRFELLEAALPVAGRGLTLWQQAYKPGSAKNAEVQKRFLRRLKAVLPPDKPVVLITDAGFQLSFFSAAESFGFHWVTRLGNSVLVQSTTGGEWMSPDHLSFEAGPDGADLGWYRVGKRTRERKDARLCIVRGERRGRTDRPNDREHGHGSMAEKYRALYSKGWTLATNLEASSFDAGQIVALYSLRMQIEEMFRDMKSHRFGSGLDYSGSRIPKRVFVLRLIASLAMFFRCLTGLAARAQEMDVQMQVNTERRRTVLSWHFLGSLLHLKPLKWLAISDLQDILGMLREVILPMALRA